MRNMADKATAISGISQRIMEPVIGEKLASQDWQDRKGGITFEVAHVMQEAPQKVADAPQKVAEVAKAAAPEVLSPKTPDESLSFVKPEVGQRAPDTTTLRKGAVEDASRQTASQVTQLLHSLPYVLQNVLGVSV